MLQNEKPDAYKSAVTQPFGYYARFHRLPKLAAFCENVFMDNVITLQALEKAINYWRERSPSIGEESRLCPQAAALSVPYALMIISHRTTIALSDLTPSAGLAFQEWLQS